MTVDGESDDILPRFNFIPSILKPYSTIIAHSTHRICQTNIYASEDTDMKKIPIFDHFAETTIQLGSASVPEFTEVLFL